MAGLNHDYFAPANRQIGEAPTSPSNCRFAFGKTGGAFCATQGRLGDLIT